MTVDSLKALITNIPDWLKRLEELNGQIEQRQLDLAMLPENRPKSVARSVRNQGSTESLKPKDDVVPVHQHDIARPSTPPPPTRNDTRQQDGAEAPSSPVSEPRSTTSLQRQTNEVMAAAQRRARATLRKRQKTDSMVSNENNVSRYRSRNMIIVYYDSYVQSFFEELVKFVSMQRNSMRRAKMAAKVAHIRRLAELEIPDDDDDDGVGGGGSGELKPSNSLIAADPNPAASESKPDELEPPKLQYISTRRMGPRNLAAGRMSMRVSQCGLNGGLGSLQDGRRDVWEELDKSLEFVQGMCEHGAHQFLRDGDCSDEIDKIKIRLAQTKVAADKELARALAENPDNAPSPAPIKSRSFRPTTMRRGVMNASPPKSPPKQDVIEVEDEGVQDMDDFQPASKPMGQTDGHPS
ncbi:hypothetical protein GGS26DRAFT_406822 [Hypomontagnella submonticulosa]|nr:hypothetical protein GGS26DRAFT_406822 [Hypomontagnella submonticulosa]